MDAFSRLWHEKNSPEIFLKAKTNTRPRYTSDNERLPKEKKTMPDQRLKIFNLI